MKPLLAGLSVVALLGGHASLEAQYLAPRQYLQRLPQTQTPAAPAPYGLPPGPTVTPPPNSTAAPTAAEANKAAANKEAALKRITEFQRKRAEGGSASAQYTLGMRYVQGDGVEKNLAEGCKWLRASAKQDHVWARKKLVELEKELGPLPPDPVVKPDADPPPKQPATTEEPAGAPSDSPATSPGS